MIAHERNCVCALQAGQVLRVFMKNLRCHKFMEVRPITRVNFVTGANGSGKSTILTAIRLALGWNPPKVRDGNASRPSHATAAE